MRCIIYELKLTAGKIIHTQEAEGGTNPCKRGGKQFHILVQRSRSEDSITVQLSLLCLWKNFPPKKLGKKYEKIKCHFTEILLRICRFKEELQK